MAATVGGEEEDAGVTEYGGGAFKLPLDRVGVLKLPIEVAVAVDDDGAIEYNGVALVAGIFRSSSIHDD